MTSQLENVAHKLDQKWVEEELIPLLVAAYGEQENGQWAEMVQRAAEALHELVSTTRRDRGRSLDDFADFPSPYTKTSILRSSAFACYS
jgi:Mlc titration factor MtfA (ptsG expression regulator)